MPAEDVTVTVTFKEADVVPPVAYTITVTPAENGTVTASAETAEEGTTVTLTITADEGYEEDTVTVMAGETPVAVTEGAFTMPAADVTVTVTFKEAESQGGNDPDPDPENNDPDPDPNPDPNQE